MEGRGDHGYFGLAWNYAICFCCPGVEDRFGRGGDPDFRAGLGLNYIFMGCPSLRWLFVAADFWITRRIFPPRSL